jgi:hypothetical protein
VHLQVLSTNALLRTHCCKLDYQQPVKTGTPDLTRLVILDSDYGKDVVLEDTDGTVSKLKQATATSKKSVKKQPVSKVHDTKRAFTESDL